ncbi:endonuclease domain-containing protein [Photobacterium damselae]|uniref:endonuclease domain-containing protein n=1 Tax=Photobacterium damselae TaxID=38293 RepID=UPI000D6688ED|nr:hypothetical protein [Photobacterium damselae]AWK84720.1 hypothetical protein BST98_22110 [Photobacterium damselae]MCG3826268.1 hypothetical protein [Photobacterium damselae]
MSNKITKRPEQLEEFKFYSELPAIPVAVDKSSLHDFLQFDLYDLDGIQPLESFHFEKEGDVVEVQPSERLIDIYEQKNIRFQMVNIVANLYGFKEVDGVLYGKPYSICLQPMSKRGKVTKIEAGFFRSFRLDELDGDYCYLGFNPFKLGYDMYGKYSTFISMGKINEYSDMVGFTLGTYALAENWNFDDICLVELKGCNDFLKKKYRKYRIRRYFTKFDNIYPRKIWGCDSPIELFLLQAFDSIGLEPEIQTGIFEDGSTYPSLHHMLSSNKRECEIRQITDADFYFREQKLAVFCDSNSYHSSPKKRAKDKKIDEQLEALGIRSIRLRGSDINDDPVGCAKKVAVNL